MRIFLTLLWATIVPLAAMAKLPANQPNLTIMADPSLLLPLAELAREYSKTTGTPLTIVAEDGRDPAIRIEQGFEAHVLLSADPTLVARLAQSGLIDVFGTLSFARTQLALVAPNELKQTLAFAKHISFAALLFSHPELPIYISDPSTPEGLRAQKLMEGREFSSEIAARAQMKPDREAVLEAIKASPGFGLILAADAVATPGVTILSLLPEETSEPVRYDAVVLASEAMSPARRFTRFLTSEEARAIFSHYGFQPPAIAK